MSDETADTTPAASWAVVELMGHRKLAGLVSEEIRFGVPMCRIDVPANGEIAAFTQLYGGASIYAMTPVSEKAVRVLHVDDTSKMPLDYVDPRFSSGFWRRVMGGGA